MTSRALIVAHIDQLTARLASDELQGSDPTTAAPEKIAAFEALHKERADAIESLSLFDAAFRYGLTEAGDYATADVIAAATYRDYQRADDNTRAAIAKTEQRRQVKDRRAFQAASRARV